MYGEVGRGPRRRGRNATEIPQISSFTAICREREDFEVKAREGGGGVCVLWPYLLTLHYTGQMKEGEEPFTSFYLHAIAEFATRRDDGNPSEHAFSDA